MDTSLQKLNILIISTRLHIGGLDRHIVDLANGLVQRGHHVWVATSGGLLQDELDPSVHAFVLPFHKLASPWSLLAPHKLYLAYKIWSHLHRLQREAQIDLIHAHAVAEGFFARLARCSNMVPVIFSCHGTQESAWPVLGKRLPKIADFYIGVSRSTSHYIAKYTGCNAEKIATINYGIHMQTRTAISRSERQRYRSQWLRHPEGKVVITVSRLHEQKGHDLLFRAISHILSRHPHTIFVLVGDGPLAKKCRRLLQELKLSHAVVFLGEKRDVWPYLQSADLFCLPSRYEALPLVIPEAYVAGLPVVAFAVNGVPEIVQHGVTGFLVPPQNPYALAHAINTALSEQGKLDDMARQAQAYGRSEFFSPTTVLDRIEKLYQMVIVQHREQQESRAIPLYKFPFSQRKSVR